ncbi:MAG: hypothetical protein JW740_00185 [Candidatus Zambryskibacteria bacterium]|nr:hypothetical protein [Candidatus Zambryskibacteria bacterium]
MRKLQKATLRIFLSCMVITAILMLIAIWGPMEQSSQGPNTIMQYVLTFFVVGLASFLTWFTTMIIEMRNKLTEGRLEQ